MVGELSSLFFRKMCTSYCGYKMDTETAKKNKWFLLSMSLMTSLMNTETIFVQLDKILT